MARRPTQKDRSDGVEEAHGPRWPWIALLVVAVMAFLAVVVVAIAEIDRRRGRRVRCKAAEYYRLGSWAVAPYNVWAARNGREKPTPWLDVDDVFPGGATLRTRWREIAAEAAHAVSLADPVDDEPLFRRIAPPGQRWRRFPIRWYGPTEERARSLCPVTCALLDTMPEVHLATFSVLEPGAVVVPHRGPFRGALRYHLGLCVPDEDHLSAANVDDDIDDGKEGKEREASVDDACRLVVDGTAYRWGRGRHVLFDDTYVHEVRNLCDSPRIVLFCDVERPMRTEAAQAVNTWVCRTFGPLSTRTNDRTERQSAQRIRATDGKYDRADDVSRSP